MKAKIKGYGGKEAQELRRKVKGEGRKTKGADGAKGKVKMDEVVKKN